MKRLAFFLAMAGCLAATGVAEAHLFGPNGEGNPYFAPAVPDEFIPTYDGDLSDWAWFPPAYTFTPDWFIQIGNFTDAEADVPKDDFDVIIYGPAWIPSQNMLTWAVHKVDNIFFTRSDNHQDSWDEDVIQFAIDADHGGEDKGNDQEYQQSFFSPKLGGALGLYGDVNLLWAYQPPHAFFGISPSRVEGTNGTFDVEVQLHIWDHLDPAGASASTLHRLQAGQIIGTSIEIIDSEEGVSEFPDVEFDFGNIAIGGSVVPDYYLMSVEDTRSLIPTAVENTSWGRVKRALAE
jgi:hypothetical protein